MTDPTTPPASEPPVSKKSKRPLSRARRWANACGAARDAINSISSDASNLAEALSELRAIQEEYEEWKDNLPENLASSPLGEKLEEVCNLEIEDAADKITDAVDEVDSMIGDAENAELPQGFGRD